MKRIRDEIIGHVYTLYLCDYERSKGSLVVNGITLCLITYYLLHNGNVQHGKIYRENGLVEVIAVILLVTLSFVLITIINVRIKTRR